MAQALQFTSDFKLGHYMKSSSALVSEAPHQLISALVPPRTMFVAQITASVIAGTVQLGVQAWMFTNIK